MALKITRDIVVRSKFLIRKDSNTNEIISVIAPNGLQIGLSGSNSVTADFNSYGKSNFYSGLSGSLTQLTDGTSYLKAGSNVTITSESNGAVTVSAAQGGGGSPGGSDTQVQYNDGGSFGGAADLTFNDSTGDITVGTSTGDAKLFFRDSGIFVNSPADGNLAVSADGKVLILSGGAAASTNEAAGADVVFYVSGTVGSQGTTTRGTSVFGGDLYVSGALHGATSTSAGGSNTQIQYNALGLLAGSADLIFNSSNGDVRIAGSTGTGQLQFRDADLKVYSPADATLAIDSDGQVLILSGGAAASTNEAAGADVAFYVSGTIASKNTSIQGASLFGGDVFVSGTLYPGAQGNLASLDFGTTTNTTKNVVDLRANSLSTGGILSLVSDSPNISARTLVKVRNDNIAAVSTVVMHLINDAVGGFDDPILLIESTAAETHPVLKLKRLHHCRANTDADPRRHFS